MSRRSGTRTGSTSSRRNPKAKTSQGKGLFSQVFNNPVSTVTGNLLNDVKDTVVGLPTGLVMLAKDPVKVGKAMAESTWDTWSPLFAGDFEKFGKQVYDHPLAPILDIVSIATFGAGTAAKGVKVLGMTDEATRLGRFANPALTRTLRSGHTGEKGAVVPHTKGYHRNPLIRARQQTMEKAVNSMAGLVPSWFAVDKAIPEEVAAKFGGAERADAWRWLRADKYDEASRRHATSAASSLAIAGIMAASKRLKQDPAQAAAQFIPSIVQNLRDHAHLVKESDLPEPLRRSVTDADIAKMDRAARKKFEAEQTASTSTALVKHDPDAEDIVDSYGFEVPEHIDRTDKFDTINDRYVFIDKDAEVKVNDFLRRNPNIDAQGLADFLASRGKYTEGKGMAGKLVTTDWRRAARAENGDFLVARNHAKYLEEAAASTNFLGQLGKSATTAWKWAILGMRPAYLVNNAVGNMFMYMVSQGPQGMRGLTDAMRQLYTPTEIQKGLSRAERKFFRSSHDWQDRYYLGLHRGFSKDASDMLAGETVRIPFAELGGKAAKLKRIAGAGLYDVTHVVSDRVLRRAAINTILRQHPEVQKLMKEGTHFDDAAAAVSQSRAVREHVQEQVNNVLGQYHYLNPAERAVRAIVPFYTWDRAIVRHGAHLYLDRPFTAAVMTQLGAQGVETTEQMLGEIPDFLRGALPLSLIGLPEQVDGRVPIMGTAGFNPYSSLDAIIRTGQALTTGSSPAGEAVAGQLNPFLTALIEQTTGQRLLSGARLPESATQGGMLQGMLASVIGNLPQVKIADTALTGPSGNDETLYPNDAMQFIYAYLGVPAKALNTEVAAEMARRRAGVTGSTRKSRRGG